jgi:iron complex transport system ATP-binding protein
MLEAREIKVDYGTRRAVDGISLRAQPGEVVAIIGPNGSGKSTFLRVLNGTLTPARGEVLLDGKSIGSYSRRAVARRVGVVAQEADLRFPVTVMEFVLGGRYAWSSAGAWGWESEHDVATVREIVKEAELSNFESRLMNELSGGERQRAVVARALATEAKVFLLDEPTANLDLAHQATMLRLVRDRCNDQESAAIVVTHDVNLAAEFADQIMLFLKNGREIAKGPPQSVFTPELLRKVFDLEVLVDAHPVSGAPRITPVHVMKSVPPA